MQRKIYLASKSPRRQELLKLMNIDYTLFLQDADESYPDTLKTVEVAEFIANKKLANLEIPTDGIVLTADTIVVVDDEILGKPKDEEDAFLMLKKLSGRMHKVITGVCLKSTDKQISFSETTEVYFRVLKDEEILSYIKKYKPLDKAGSYGIQEWIGITGITRINGSYTNVVGLPSEKVFAAIENF